MRLIFLIIFVINISLSYASANYYSPNIVSVSDGGNKHFSKKHYKKKHVIKVNRRKQNKKTVPSPIKILETKKHTKGKAILMAVLTGPLGGHRLYLGTKPYVPIVYALTLGGGLGLLPAIDIVVIILSKDLSPYYNNPQIMMW